MNRAGEHAGGRAGERGSATAELAVAMPAVVIVLAACVWGVQLAAVQVRLQDAAGLAARSAARGDDLGSARAAMPGAAITLEHRGDLVCATAGAEVRSPIGAASVALSATSCALAESR